MNNNYREMSHTGSIALSNESIMETAPSVFATAPHHEVSDRYGFMPTINVIDALRSEGWMPVDATQKNVRDSSKRDLTTHLVRFRRVDNDIQVGDSVVEILLKNSHDRSSAFVLHAGIFRMACANGIVIADSTFNKLSVRHGKNVVGEIIEGSCQVIDEVPAICDTVEGMQGTELSGEERAIFAHTAYTYAHGERDENMLTSKESIINQMLRPKRRSDTGKDLWSTFNVIQENIIKGGIRTAKVNDKGRMRRSTKRAVGNIEKNIKLNKAIFEMATQMQALKA
jgi:hypothetical protein